MACESSAELTSMGAEQVGASLSRSPPQPAPITRREQPALALVPRDPICTLRFRDWDGPAIDLSPAQSRLVIGSAPTCDVIVPPDLAAAVSPQHAAMERTGTGFLVRDLSSKNGTYASPRAPRRELVAVEPGDTFWIANVGVTVTDGTLDVLRAHLLCHVGLDDTAAVDQAMEDIASGAPLLLRGPIGTGARRLARLIHDTSPQRANPHIVGAAPVCLLAHAQGATVYLDLSALPPLLSHYAARLSRPPAESASSSRPSTSAAPSPTSTTCVIACEPFHSPRWPSAATKSRTSCSSTGPPPCAAPVASTSSGPPASAPSSPTPGPATSTSCSPSPYASTRSSNTAASASPPPPSASRARPSMTTSRDSASRCRVEAGSKDSQICRSVTLTPRRVKCLRDASLSWTIEQCQMKLSSRLSHLEEWHLARWRRASAP